MVQKAARATASDALVLFGVTGDLAHKMIFPALYAMAARGALKVPVVGVASTQMTVTALRTRIRESIRASGVKVDRVKMFVYMFSGFCAAIVGLIITSQLVAAHPATGETFELNAIAAAVLGGTSMSGGRGRIAGTVIGAFVIGILADGLAMMGVSSFWQTVIKGLVIIAAVVVDQAQQRLQSNVALRRQAALGR